MIFEDKVYQVILISESPTRSEIDLIQMAKVKKDKVIHYEHSGGVSLESLTEEHLNGIYSLELTIIE